MLQISINFQMLLSGTTLRKSLETLQVRAIMEKNEKEKKSLISILPRQLAACWNKLRFFFNKKPNDNWQIINNV